jgi:hypothetical protein
MEDLRSTTDWLVEFDVRIVDPDGWRSPDALGFDVPISRDEFMARLNVSTVDHRPRDESTRGY